MEDFINITDKKPSLYQEIIIVTSCGKMDGFYLKSDIAQTKRGLFNFTKWKPKA